ncbi:hypothetical protein KY320_01420 [Candidatus Woesearchaeota archaeon]|nr:hypothetical protein [Candidatus Woesearchaeota archaeon]
MNWDDWNLRGNPFIIKNTFSINECKRIPIVMTEKLLSFKFALTDSLTSEEKYHDFELILGHKGIGKTTALLWLYSIALDFDSENWPVEARYIKNIGDGTVQDIIKTLFASNPDMQENLNWTTDELKDYLGKTKVYMFIDMPDQIKKSYFARLASFLEYCGSLGITVFMAMNYSHKSKLEENTEILGKFRHCSLSKFTVDETKEMIQGRLSTHKINHDLPAQPFKDEQVIKHIWRYGAGIPRNILVGCSEICRYALGNGMAIISSETAESILASENYVQKILKEKVEDDTMREQLYGVYMILKNDFEGTAKSQKALINAIRKKLDMSQPTVIKRIQKLESLGLIGIRSSSKDLWTKVIATKEFEKQTTI